ncbi:TlpA disulfide reductase family protein [Solitalea koreensis]|uniref:Thiol-disulfide isomerase or thioredoxin n=1 Tax=Solitalea koreensis TaxID=543615 RepID=A0A521DSF5_9SPHI|nr:TlpA disulfide reductase family protein [Solitalea koreensis]SMO74639.1 Thiol-disulfide isomerase or thioredoxin [Solitalea koreensis]
MNKILVQMVLVVCGWIFTAQVFAADGIKTVVKGSLTGTKGKIFLFIRGGMMKTKAADSINNGRFNLETTLDKPGFYLISTPVKALSGFDIYLSPGDDLTMKMEKDGLVMTGKGSRLNQFLFDLNKKFPYSYQADQATISQTYKNRITEINASTNEEVLRNKAILLGYAQGEYLDKVYGEYVNSKVFGSTDEIKDVNFTDYNMTLLPEIVNYYNWRETISELMYSKMSAGQLKVRNMNTWVADFGSLIENQKLREDYMVALIKFSVLLGDFTSIHDVIKEALPLIKDPKNIAALNELNGKISEGVNRYKNALPGTDLSAFTFVNADGKEVAIRDYKGKYIFIDIWNTGCHPCVAEMPFLNKIEHEMQGKDIAFVSISCDTDTELWKSFLKKRNLKGEQLLMKGAFKDPFFKQIGLSGIPRFLILDKAGRMVDYNSCKRPSNPLLKKYLTELLNQ